MSATGNHERMNPLLRKSLALCCIACAALTTTALAEPIEFSEVSLLVRARESEPSIIQEVTRRKLVRPLTPQQENTLRTHGAGESLIQALRGSAVLLSQADAAAFDTRRGGERKATAHAAAATNRDAQQGNIHIFEISAGHPVNLSQWGGPDYEFAFHGTTRLDEGREDAVMIDNTRSFTHVATYLAAGRAEDSTTILDRRNYVAVADHSFTRGLRIDRRNPVWKKGVPYALYPVYAAGGVSLYYIGGSSDSVRLAVSTTTH
jgi:hypothetical protein